MAVESDPASFIVKLAESLKGFKGSSDWINTLREKDNSKEEVNQYKGSFFLLLYFFFSQLELDIIIQLFKVKNRLKKQRFT